MNHEKAIEWLAEIEIRDKQCAQLLETIIKLRGEIDRLKADLAMVSAEFGLPPAMGLAPGEITRILSSNRDSYRAEVDHLKAEKLAETDRVETYNRIADRNHRAFTMPCPACGRVAVVIGAAHSREREG